RFQLSVGVRSHVPGFRFQLRPQPCDPIPIPSLVIPSEVRRQPNAVEGPCVPHGRHDPKEFFHQGFRARITPTIFDVVQRTAVPSPASSSPASSSRALSSPSLIIVSRRHPLTLSSRAK